MLPCFGQRVNLKKRFMPRLKTLIIIPTYNEKENIAPLIKDIFSVLPSTDILVIDDNSPDKTGEIVESLSRENPRIKLIKRDAKLGLGSAYVAGFQYAVSCGHDFIFQMDADFSHHPRYLAEFLKEAENYPVVLGSRYIRGGKILGWSIFRRILSRLGNFYARLLLGLKIKDLTGGYKCFRGQAIKQILATPLNSEGYIFQIEATFRAYKEGFAVKEIPIIFENRRKGSSKISKGIIFEALLKVPLMLFSRAK